MKKRIAINGFGRIGRLVFRQMMEEESLEVAGLNDIAPLDNLAYLLRHDSVHVNPTVPIMAKDNALSWDGKNIPFSSERDPSKLPWKKLEVDILIEASGRFRKYDDAKKHLDAGAGRVIITAPGKGGNVVDLCMGVNEDRFDMEKDFVMSNVSCTTNCLAPVAKVLDENFGIDAGFVTTVHAVTSSQFLVDTPYKKWRRGRSALNNMVPTTTGATDATVKVMPHLDGKLDGMAMRVPVPDGSVIDFIVHTDKPMTVESVNEAFCNAAQSDRLKGIIGVSEDALVSSDIIGSTYSALVDLPCTKVVRDCTARVMAWYDNEWGYARRVVDLTVYVSQRI
jgi:glyceraldehyde 3-phosphate dehydrogenase